VPAKAGKEAQKMSTKDVDPHHHDEVVLSGNALTIEDVVAVARWHKPARLANGAMETIQACREWVDQVVREGKPRVYGLNTGFGALADVVIPPEKTAELSQNLIRSHSVGVGEPSPQEVVRAALLIRANTLAKGHSGVRVEIIETLIEMLDRGVHPVVPEKGSVGASGDLAQLSHMALVLMGEGEASYQGQRMFGGEAMRRAGLQPLSPLAKEGLALINGATFTAAIASLALHDAERLVKNAEIALAMSLEAVRGSRDAFDERVHQARRHDGQQRTAGNVLALIEGSELITQDPNGKVQDAYSLRCAPQVLGAARDALAFVRMVVENEINAATDNPLLFLDLERENKAISCGNFHGEPLAFAMDLLGIVVAEIGNIAERRVFRLTDPTLSEGLPAMLVKGSGLNSGLMLLQCTAAALVSDNKTLAHPDSVDSVPTSANQEDHVSMSLNAARHAREILWNVETIVGIEMLCAAQALDFRKLGLCFSKTEWDPSEEGMTKLRKVVTYELKDGRTVEKREPGRGARAAYSVIRQAVPFVENDRVTYEDIDRVTAMVHSGEIVQAVEKELGKPLKGLAELVVKPG
jgi:histidine ammonia-lyase